MGAGDSRNIDKRTVRRQYREAYQGAIETIRHSLETVPASSSGSNANKSRDVKVYIRKRPIFNKEISSGEFDVITCPKSADTEGYGKKLIIHDARIQSDMRHQFINNYEFNFDRVFNESATSYEVYETAAAPLVDIAYNGGYATCLVYGQTGSGKSFTMSSIYEEAAKSIFRLVNSGKAPSIAGNDAKDASSFGDVEVSASFFEISGETISDLLGNFRPAKLISGKEGCTHPLPVLEVPLTDVDELLEMISFARSVRRTAATGVNDVSSRSHSIFRIYVLHNKKKCPSEEGSSNSEADDKSALSDKGEEESAAASNIDLFDGCVEGTLTLVDLAGSEHNIDSMHHNVERRKECALINTSLLALKDCIRSRYLGEIANHHFRRSKLTMALKGAFVVPNAKTVVIATVAPSSKDTEHSLDTIKHACMMDGGKVVSTSSGGSSGGVYKPSSSGGGASSAAVALGSSDSSCCVVTQVGVVTRVHPSKKAKLIPAASLKPSSAPNSSNMIPVDSIFPNKMLEGIKTKVVLDSSDLKDDSADCHDDDAGSENIPNLPTSREEAEAKAFGVLSEKGRDVLTSAREALNARQLLRQQCRLAVSASASAAPGDEIVL